MPRSSRPRKAYRPRALSTDPVEQAIAGAATPPVSTLASLIGPMRQSLDELRRGDGCKASWECLADALNVAQALTDLGIAPDHRDTIVRACRSLGTLSERVNASGSWTLRAAELTALQDACEIHEIQLELASQREIRDAITAVQRRVRGVLSGSAPARAHIACIGALGRPRPTTD
jgi:hypothetical protein